MQTYPNKAPSANLGPGQFFAPGIWKQQAASVRTNKRLHNPIFLKSGKIR